MVCYPQRVEYTVHRAQQPTPHRIPKPRTQHGKAQKLLFQIDVKTVLRVSLQGLVQALVCFCGLTGTLHWYVIDDDAN